MKAKVLKFHNIDTHTVSHQAVLTTRYGKIYYVWIGNDGLPLIELAQHDQIPAPAET